MARWATGVDTIRAMLDRRELQPVAGGSDAAKALLDSADKHVDSAALCLASAPEAAFGPPTTPPASPPQRSLPTKASAPPPAADTSQRSKPCARSFPASPD